MSWKERLTDVLAEGILWGVYYWLLFAVIIPLLVNRLLGGIVSEVIVPETGELTGLIFLFMGLSLAAAALRGTIYSPLIGALESILGFAVVVYFLDGGVVSVSLDYGGPISVTLDLSPILMEVFLFFTLPGVVLPFVEYFIKRSGG
ncbi:MAG: hypothetical protein QI199_06940 [Candidatus Korarchaeota archaeon]|nr:hypothetical protein [Candidatus Korarchaeota archaeon]